jgi:hypothetical protein
VDAVPVVAAVGVERPAVAVVLPQLVLGERDAIVEGGQLRVEGGDPAVEFGGLGRQGGGTRGEKQRGQQKERTPRERDWCLAMWGEGRVEG